MITNALGISAAFTVLLWAAAHLCIEAEWHDEATPRQTDLAKSAALAMVFTLTFAAVWGGAA